MADSVQDTNPYRSPDNPQSASPQHSPLLDAWFVLFPLAMVLFYAHWLAAMAFAGTTFFSPFLPEGHPGHVSMAGFGLMFGECVLVASVWLATVAWSLASLRGCRRVRYPAPWTVGIVLVAPLVAPMFYFLRLRSNRRMPSVSSRR